MKIFEVTFFFMAAGMSGVRSFAIPNKLNRQERQAAFLGSGENLQPGLGGSGQLLTQTITVNGQNVTVPGGLSAASWGVESGEILGMTPNLTSFIVGQILGLGNNRSAILLDDRKKRQVSVAGIGQPIKVGGIVGMAGLSIEASREMDGLPLMAPDLTGQATGLTPGASLLLGDRKKRQVTLGTAPLQIPTRTLNVNGQNLTVAGGLSGLSMEASFGSPELVLNSNGTFSLFQPALTGQAIDANNPAALFLGDRKKRQITLGQGTFPILTQTINVNGQNLTLAGGWSGLSMEASFGSPELVLNSNGTFSLFQPALTGQAIDANNPAALFLGDRKKRQITLGQGTFPIPTQTINVNGQNLTLAGGWSGLSMEASFGSPELVLNSNGTVSVFQPTLTGQAIDANNPGTLFLGDRKKRQITLGQGTFPIPTQTINVNGQNLTLAGGLSGLSMEASFGSPELVLNSNGTFSLFQPALTGQAIDANNPAALFLGDRKKRQITLGQGTFPIPTQTINVNGQNLTLAGGWSGLSMEASFGSPELVLNSNGTVSVLQPALTGQAIDFNNPGALFLGDRKKRQITLGQGTFPIPTQTINVNGQNLTVAGGLSGLSMEASLGSPELVLNSNGTFSLFQPALTGQAIDANNPGALFLGDRKKRQITLGQGTFPIPTQTINVNGQNLTVAGGLSGLSMEASFGSPELVLNSNGTFSLLQPTLTGQAIDANNPGALFLGDRKKRQITLGQRTFPIPTQTINVNGQNLTVAGGLSGLSMEASLGSPELVLNSNGTFSLFQPALTGQAIDANNAAALFLGDRKKRQITLGQGTFPIPTQAINVNGQNLTVAGGLSGLSMEASLGSLELVLNSNGTFSLFQPALTGQAIDVNNARALFLGDRKKRQVATKPAVTPEDLVLTAAAIDVQTRTLFPGAAEGDDGIMSNMGLDGEGFDMDREYEGAIDENLCVCSSQLCASWPTFIDTCRKIQSSSECVTALEQLMIVECPDAS